MDAINKNNGPFYLNQSLTIVFDTNQTLSNMAVKVKAINPNKQEMILNGGFATGSKFTIDFKPNIAGNWKFWLYAVTNEKPIKTLISSPRDINIRKEGT